MKTWLKRIRGALMMGVIWAVAWMPIGLLIGMIIDPDGAMDEPWIAVGTLPGFFAGVCFSVVLGIAARRQRLDEVSVARVARWGMGAGLLLSFLWFLSGDQDGREGPLWVLPVVIISALTLLTTVSAAGTLMIARKSTRLELTEGSANITAINMAELEIEELPRT